jgi:hypothetical protein
VVGSQLLLAPVLVLLRCPLQVRVHHLGLLLLVLVLLLPLPLQQLAVG